jgi:hypothetical protein
MSNDPVLIAYAVHRDKSGKCHWTRIGRAFPHDAGAGLTVLLDSMPLDGRIVLLELDEDDDRRLMSEAAMQRAVSGRPPKRHPARPRATDPVQVE